LNNIDFIIVGQGLAGTLLAHDLIDAKKNILIIDKKLKASASKVAAGLINPVGMKRCIPSFMSDVYLPKALNTYRSLEKKLKVSFLDLKPIVRLFSNLDVKRDWEIKYSNENMDKYISSFNNSDKFSFLKDSFGSANVEPAGHLDVNLFLDKSREYFKLNNLLINEIFNFDFFDENNISYKSITAKKIIFCEGFRLRENPFFKYLPITPTKGEVIKIRVPSKKNFGRIISKGIYILPLGDYIYLVGATYNRIDFTDALTEQGQAFLKTKINEVLNVDYEIVSSVAGVRPTTKDRRPLLGLHPKNPSIAVFNGLGTRGVLQGPSLSNELCDFLIRSKSENSISKFNNISRFN
jgi:glycine oxidase